MRWLVEKGDLPTLLMLLALSAVSVTAVYSATHGRDPSFFAGPGGKQLLYVLLGVVVYIVVQRVGYHDWAELAWVLYIGGLVVLVAVVLLARPIAGARSWFEIGPFRFQPSEPMKALTALACASFLARRPPTLDFKLLLQVGLLVAAPMALILLQPDMGSALTYLPLLVGLAWTAGLRPKVIVVLALIAAIAAPVLWFTVLKDYQKERIINVLDPERDPMGSGYQTNQSRIAIGSGEVFGKGLLQGSQSRLEFLPARETDFILALVAEETGFVGVLLVLALFGALLMRGLKTALTAQDYLGTLLAVGIVAMLAGQLFVNTGMVTGVLPTIGVTFPGLSYGGSSVLATFLAFGLVSSVRAGRLVNA